MVATVIAHSLLLVVETAACNVDLATDDALEIGLGSSKAVVYFADTKLRRGTTCDLDKRMLDELKNLLGESNVVVK